MPIEPTTNTMVLETGEGWVTPGCDIDDYFKPTLLGEELT